MNQGHGWVNKREDGAVARCGGPIFCAECKREAAIMDKKVIHKQMTTYALLCGKPIKGTEHKHRWKDVTCKACMKKRLIKILAPKEFALYDKDGNILNKEEPQNTGLI